MNKTGFGFLRLPRLDQNDEKSVNYELLNELVDAYLEKGGTYFDTAFTYLDGVSEEALRKSLVERHPRSSFRIATKLPGYKVKSHEECWEYFDIQLKRCGVNYFDTYLLHWLNNKNYALAEQYDEFRFLRELKESGKAKQIGFSFHDGPELLDQILTAHPEVDIILIQVNYLDWNSEALRARELYEVGAKHGKKIRIMEPVKGGNLVNLPDEAAALLKNRRPNDSLASWAIRFASSLEQVDIVLSGMNSMEQIHDNMRDLEPVTDEERELLEQAATIIRSNTAIPCTGCNYCAPNCPMNIPIPRYFSMFNDYKRNPGDMWKMKPVYGEITQKFGPASACIGCKNCERNCPQKLEITSFLKEVKEAFEA